jgi:hypothetical protein
MKWTTPFAALGAILAIQGTVAPLNPLARGACVRLYVFMSSVAEIDEAIAKLPPEEFGQLERWFDAERNRKWDWQIEEDGQSGKLHEMYQRLQSENKGQPSFSLDEFLDNEQLS